MNEIRPVDANELKESIVENIRELGDKCSPVMLTMFGLFSDIIDNAPTVDTSEKYNDGYEKGYKHGYKDGQNSRRPGCECKDCKYYFNQVGRCENCSRNHWYSDNFIRKADMRGGDNETSN